MRRRDVGRHRQGKASASREAGTDPSRRSGRALPRARVDAALEPAFAGRGLEGFPPPGPWRDNRRATRHPWRRPRPSRPTAGSARKRLRARTGNGPGSKCEARNQKRRGAGPCRIRRSGSEPCLPIRFARTTRGARTPTRAPRSPPGVTRKPLFDSETGLPASPRGIWRARSRPARRGWWARQGLNL